MRCPYPALHPCASHAIWWRMTDIAPSARATQRPRPFAKPAHWSDAPPPAPQASQESTSGLDTAGEELSPTRYGDWVKDGIAIDF